MTRTKIVAWWLAVSALLVASPSLALTETYALSSSGGTGILAGNAVACPSVAVCLSGAGADFENASLALASGSLAIVDTATPGFPTGTLSLSVPSITLSGGPLGGIDEIILTGLTASFAYPSFGLLESAVGGGLLSIVGAGATPTATLSGTIATKLAGGTVSGPAAFSTTATASAINCIVSPGQCGVQLDFSDGGLEYRLTLNLNAVPEPAIAGLLLASAGGLAAWRRTRGSNAH